MVSDFCVSLNTPLFICPSVKVGGRALKRPGKEAARGEDQGHKQPQQGDTQWTPHTNVIPLQRLIRRGFVLFPTLRCKAWSATSSPPWVSQITPQATRV